MENPSFIKKIIAPVIAGLVVIALTLLWVFGIVAIDPDEFPLAFTLYFAIIAIATIGGIIFVLVERINEINGGEEDDLGKY